MVGEGPLIMKSLWSAGKHRLKQAFTLRRLWKWKILRCRKGPSTHLKRNALANSFKVMVGWFVYGVILWQNRTTNSVPHSYYESTLVVKVANKSHLILRKNEQHSWHKSCGRGDFLHLQTTQQWGTGHIRTTGRCRSPPGSPGLWANIQILRLWWQFSGDN